MSSGVPFTPFRLWTVSPSGALITGIPDRYAFEIHRTPRSVVSVRRDVSPERVTPAERDSARKSIEQRMRGIDPNWSWNGPEIPSTRPLYENIQTGLDGRIWITRVRELVPGSSGVGSSMGGRGQAPARKPVDAPPVPLRPSLFDVFEPDGTFIGQVRVPPRVAVAVRRGDYVWGIAYDDDDVASVRRYRIVWR